MKLPLLLLVFFTFPFLCVSQIDLENFNGLKSAGDIPKDFSNVTKSKLDSEKKQNKGKSKSEQLDNKLLLKTNYAIDRLLHSGDVIFGDPVTLYVEKIVDEILKDDPKLRSEIRVYTIKSNETNAFSTRQGMLFVTTGLLTQLENEAQLAFVLAHEIAHYMKRHVIESYEENERIIKGRGEFKYSSDSKVQLLSKYSKQKEFEADEIGIDLYLKLDYTKAELNTVFQVLQYSYLPFDDRTFPKTFFNDSSMFIPEEFFPEDILAITGVDDYDDSESSHPNIKKRKEHVEFYLENNGEGNGSKKYIIGKDDFKYIRDLCRFESIELDISQGLPGNAIYSIFLLQKKYPQNYFLDKNLAKAWYKLVKFKNISQFSDITVRAKKVEGESHAIHHLLKDFNKEQLNVVGLKVIYNIDKKYNFSKSEIHNLWLDGIKDFLSNEILDLDEFYDFGYLEALQSFEDSKIKKVETDSVVVDSLLLKDGDVYFDPEDETRSKYDRINSKKKNKVKKLVAKDEDDEFDIEEFHHYAWVEIINSPFFKKQVDSLENVIKIEKKEEEERERQEEEMKKRQAMEEERRRQAVADDASGTPQHKKKKQRGGAFKRGKKKPSMDEMTMTGEFGKKGE